MTAPKKNPASVGLNGKAKPAPSFPAASQPRHFSLDKIKALVAELEVPFHPSLIEWRVTNISQDESRGKIMPYADPRAYTDRLNELFTPAGWTRKYTVATSPNFTRSEDGKLVAKVFVTCELTIHGIGSHSATGEEWTDDDNAGTSAEAQAFKRACSCFGLGRYLYSFGTIWVDLDEWQRPIELPDLHGWATPEGWRQGQRPALRDDSDSKRVASKSQFSSRKSELIQKIEAMAEPLGKTLYRGILKHDARAWNPADVPEIATLENVLASMQSAEQALGRLEAVRQKISNEAMESILSSLKLKSVAQVGALETLRQLLAAAEETASQTECA